MVAKLKTISLIGIDAEEITVEVDIRGSMPGFEIVGLAGKAVQESKERVASAIRNSGFEFPLKKIIVNLAPADITKTGPSYDLPIALGILISSGQLSKSVENYYIVGELSLEGEIKCANGVLPMTDWISRKDDKGIIIPADNVKEATLVPSVQVFGFHSLRDCVSHLAGSIVIEPAKSSYTFSESAPTTFEHDFAFVKGQHQAKRALEIAAAGGHNILLNGTPGSGKSMLAKAFPSILPTLTLDEALEVTRIYSAAGLLDKNNPLVHTRPFRKPHHTSSQVSLIGGGTTPKPGEISLANRGLLFLDEFPEFSTQAIEALRQPLEDRVVTISRANGSITYPANFMLIAAMNPCKCGWKGDPEKSCTCSSIEISRYRKRISGPILDRIDLQVWVPRVTFDKLVTKSDEKSSEEIRKSVQKARNIQLSRYKEKKLKIISNAELPQKDIETYISINEPSMLILKNAVNKFNLSARSYFRILKVSRTIADLEESEIVQTNHIAEALSYRISDEI